MTEIRIKGRKVKVNDRLAAALLKMGKAQLVEAPVQPYEAKVETVEDLKPKTKRAYKRRDMSAED